MTSKQKLLTDLAANLQLINGPAEFFEDKEIFGYIKDNEKLYLPPDFKFAYDYYAKADVDYSAALPKAKTALGLTIINNDDTIKKNFDFKQATGMDITFVVAALSYTSLGRTADALQIGILRGILCAHGMLAAYEPNNWTAQGRRVYVDEAHIDTIDKIDGLTTEIVTAISDGLNSDWAKFMFRNWTSLLAILDCVFMARSHHFAGEEVSAIVANIGGDTQGRYSYAALYRVLMTASFPDEQYPFNAVKSIFRTALHPFGVNIPRFIHTVLAKNRKLPSALLVRSHPAPAGTAKVTTAAAIINMMVNSPYFSADRVEFEKKTASIKLVADRIALSPESYHQCSSLYNHVDLTDEEKRDLKNALNSAQGLAPLLVAYIRTECDTAPISQQKTLNKPANDQAGLLRRLERLFRRLAESSDEIAPSEVLHQLIAARTELVQPVQEVPD